MTNEEARIADVVWWLISIADFEFVIPSSFIFRPLSLISFTRLRSSMQRLCEAFRGPGKIGKNPRCDRALFQVWLRHSVSNAACTSPSVLGDYSSIARGIH